jgi:flavin reductase (DIM6/NTAB) family NADH-FMN oxidoreductase RutF
LVSTIDREGGINLSPFSFFNVFSANPPVAIFSPARAARDNSTKDTFVNVQEVPEAVINVVTYSMAEQVSLASTAYPKEVNEFLKSGLTAIESDMVKPPRVGESPASFECIVKQVIPLGTDGGAGNLVICEIIRLHLKSKYLDTNQNLRTESLDLVGRMGENWYTRAFGESLFQVAKTENSPGIGIDLLPESIRNSSVLTGNNLAKLGGLPQLPDHKTVEEWAGSPEIKTVLSEDDAQIKLHKMAREMIKKQDFGSAIKTLLVADTILRSQRSKI